MTTAGYKSVLGSNNRFMDILNKTVKESFNSKRPQTSKIADMRLKVLSKIDNMFKG